MNVIGNPPPPGAIQATSPSLGAALLWGLLSGLAYALAFPPLAWSPLIWVALAPWFAVATRCRPARAAAAGLAWGFGMSMGTAFWLPHLIGSYFDLSGAERWTAAGITSVAIVGVYSAAASAWLSFVVRRGVPLVLAAVLAWTFFEVARSYGPIPNPWALSAYALVDWEWLSQSADLAGPFALGALIAAFNASLVAAGATDGPRARIPLAGVVLLSVGLLGYGAWRVGSLSGAGHSETLSFAIIQTGTAPQALVTLEDSQANLDSYLELTEQALAENPGTIVVWPEGSIDFRPRGLTQRSRRLLRFTRDSNAFLLLGGPGRSAERQFNSFFALSSGRVVGKTHKVELMPFAETRPAAGLIPLGRTRLSAGDASVPLHTTAHRQETAPLAAARLGIMICSEAMVPSFVRRVVREGVELLINPANDDWFGNESASLQQLAAVRFRAIETRRSVVRSAPTGLSAFIDPRGRVIQQGPFRESAILTGAVPLSEEVSPAVWLGDFPRNFGGGAFVLATVQAIWRPRGSVTAPS